MLSINQRTRSLSAAAAAACFVSAFAAAPARVRGADAVAIAPLPAAPATARSRKPAPVVAIALDRDPFDERDPVAETSAEPAEPTLPPAAVAPLPPNLPGGMIPVLPAFAPASGPAVHVAAIVAGPHPFALAGSGTTLATVGVGDRLAGKRITAIGIDGITLDDGSRLTVDAATPSTAGTATP